MANQRWNPDLHDSVFVMCCCLTNCHTLRAVKEHISQLEQLQNPGTASLSPLLRRFQRLRPGCPLGLGSLSGGLGWGSVCARLLWRLLAGPSSQAVGQRPSAPGPLGPSNLAARFFEACPSRRQERVCWQEEVTTLCRLITEVMSHHLGCILLVRSKAHIPVRGGR